MISSQIHLQLSKINYHQFSLRMNLNVGKEPLHISILSSTQSPSDFTSSSLSKAQHQIPLHLAQITLFQIQIQYLALENMATKAVPPNTIERSQATINIPVESSTRFLCVLQSSSKTSITHSCSLFN